MNKKAQLRLVFVGFFVLIILLFSILPISFVSSDTGGNGITLPEMLPGTSSGEIVNIGGTYLNVTWKHIPTSNLTQEEFILDISQLANSSTANSTFTISPNLLLTDTNFNLSKLNSEDLEIKAYQYQEQVDYFYNYTKTGICQSNSAIAPFEVYSASAQNSVLYSVGDLVSYNGEEYECTQQIYNYNGVPSALPQYWNDLGAVPPQTNSTWNYPNCNSDGEVIILENGRIPFSEGSLCSQSDINCSASFGISKFNPVQIGSGSLPVANSMFKTPFTATQNGQDVEVGNISLNQMQVPAYSPTPNAHKYFDIKISNVPIHNDPSKVMSSTGTFIVSLGGNLVWDKTHSSWWDSSWTYKRQIDLTANAGQFSYLATINYDPHMNSDFSDIRFVNGAEDTEFKYTIEKKTDGVSATVRIYSQGETTFYMYYGNSGATTTSSASDTYFNPIAYYYLDDNANDFVGTNDGTINGATATTGKIGGAYSFDGINDYIITPLNTNDEIPLSGPFSISVWINSNTFGTSSGLASNSVFEDEGGNGGTIYFRCGNDGTNRCQFLIMDGNNNAQIINSGALNTGQWYHLVGTWDGTTNTNGLKFYIDGSLVGSGTSSSTNLKTRNPFSDFNLGRSQNNGRYFNGKIDEVGIWDKALTSTQISDLYQQTAPTYTVGSEQSGSSNTAPTLTANATSPSTVYTNTDYKVNLTATDPEETYLNSWVQFYKNDATIGGLQFYNLTNNTNSQVALLGSGNFSKTDTLIAEVIIGDGIINNSAVNLTSSVVQNTPPTIGNPTLNDSTPKTNDLILCTGNGFSDIDGDTATWYYRWYNNDVLISGQTSQTLDLSTSGLDKGDVIKCSTIASDGTANATAWTNSSTATIQNSPPVFSTIPNNDTITYPTTWSGEDYDVTDADGDSITYSSNDSRFTINSTGFLSSGSLGAGTYSILVTAGDGTTNIYSEYILTINKGTLSGSLVSSHTGSFTYTYDNTPTTISLSESNTGDSDVTYKIYRDAVDKGTGETVNLPAGTYSYVLNSTGGANWSSISSIDSQTLTINKATPSLEITGTTPITYGTTTDVSGSGCPAQLTCSLDKSNAVYGVGTETFNYSTSGNENYTANWTTKTITINKATPIGSIVGTSPIEYGTAGDVEGSESNTGDSDVTYNLYREGILVSNPDNSILSLGTYNYVYNTTGGVNYTSSSLDTFSLTVNKSSSNCQVLFNETTPINYPNSFKVYSDCDTAFTLYRNGTSISNNSQQSLGVGTYNFSVQRTDTINYSNIYDEQNFVVNKGTLVGSLVSSNGSFTVQYPSSTNISFTESNEGDSDVTYNLYNNSILFSNNTNFSDLGTYNLILNSTGGANWSSTSSIDSKTLIIQNTTTHETGGGGGGGGGGGSSPLITLSQLNISSDSWSQNNENEVYAYTRDTEGNLIDVDSVDFKIDKASSSNFDRISTGTYRGKFLLSEKTDEVNLTVTAKQSVKTITKSEIIKVRDGQIGFLENTFLSNEKLNSLASDNSLTVILILVAFFFVVAFVIYKIKKK